MDLKKYEVFVGVAETGNLTETGRRLGYTQSGVSHIIAGLEAEMGLPLIVRGRRGVGLTENGARIADAMRHLLADNERLEQTISAIRGVTTGSLVIGTYASISINWLPEILYRFRQDYPGISIHMKEGGIEEIEGWIENSIADFGFLSRRSSQSFDWIPLEEDPLLAILPKDTPCPPGGKFPIAGFEGQPFVMSAAGIDHDVHMALTNAGIHPAVRYSSADDHAIVSMVAHRLGISMLPRLIVQDQLDHITALPVEPYASRRLGIGIRNLSRLSPAAKELIEYTKRILFKNQTPAEAGPGQG
ncbi:MAG TPA: LysR family transcriptional regulator [Candidatus Limiplasma sp.]|nr:LysR family transcriptional regulator [Candidatus Limiplasma sp.]HPS81723.1 LysR family transcriptional regulator [Candidatus Limiplasma sp.]